MWNHFSNTVNSEAPAEWGAGCLRVGIYRQYIQLKWYRSSLVHLTVTLYHVSPLHLAPLTHFLHPHTLFYVFFFTYLATLYIHWHIAYSHIHLSSSICSVWCLSIVLYCMFCFCWLKKVGEESLYYKLELRGLWKKCPFKRHGGSNELRDETSCWSISPLLP